MGLNRVFINGRFLSQETTGVQRYAIQLLSSVDQILVEQGSAARLRLTVLTPRDIRHDLCWSAIQIKRVGVLNGHAWEQLELPLASASNILVSLTGSAPLSHWRQIICFHDAAVFAIPESFSTLYGAWHRLVRPALAKRALKLITVSQFSSAELAKYCGIAPNKITVINNGACHLDQVPADPAILDRIPDFPRQKYILAVGSRSKNKNTKLLREAAAAIRERGLTLVFAGGTSRSLQDEHADNYPAAMIQLGRVSDGELKALYQNALMFVFPSFYEGFGIPPLEAMKLGVPVASSSTSAMPEILREAALYFEPQDVAGLMAVIDRVASEPTTRNWLRAAGRTRAELFTWKRSAKQFIEMIAAARLEPGNPNFLPHSAEASSENQ